MSIKIYYLFGIRKNHTAVDEKSKIFDNLKTLRQLEREQTVNPKGTRSENMLVQNYFQ